MLIEFDRIETSTMNNFKDGNGIFEAKIFSDPANRFLLASLKPGSSIGMHRHETTSEFMIFTSGNGCIVCDGKEEIVSAGSVHYCPKGSSHEIVNTGDSDLRMYCIVPEQ